MTVVALHHARQERTIHPEVSHRVHVHGTLDLLVGQIEKVFSRDNAGIIDHHVHGAHLLLHEIGGLVDSLTVRHVHLVGEAPAAGRFDELLCFG